MPQYRRREGQRGLTLIEVMVVVILVAVVTAGIVAGSGQLASARLKRATTITASAVKVAYVRATATSKSVRIVFDLDQSKIWLEEATQPMLVQAKGDKTGTGGLADPATEAEKAAVAEGERIVKGPQAPRAQFRPVKAPGFEDAEKAHADTSAGRELGRNIKIRSVQTSHDEEPRTAGRAYLYFWPGGQTERASIQLRVGASIEDTDTLSLVVSPLTGKGTVKNGPFALEKAADRDGSEREDRGF